MIRPRARRQPAQPAPGHAEDLARWLPTRQDRGPASLEELTRQGVGNGDLSNWFSFDYVAGIALPIGTGDVAILGENTAAPTQIVPDGFEGLLDDIEPYLEGAAGPITVPVPPGAGVSILWRVMVNGAPLIPYGAIPVLLGYFGTRGGRPLARLEPRSRIGASVNVTDPSGLYTRIGIRLRGRFLPLRTTPEQAP